MKKSKINLKWVEKQIGTMPLLPATICDLLALDTASPNFFDNAFSLIRRSPSLAAKMLELANSAEVSPLEPITDIRQALIRIGISKVISRITLTSVYKVFTPKTASQFLLWKHAIQTAYLAELIAKSMGSNINKDFAYTCGLLHDLGRFTLFELSEKAVDYIDSVGWDSPVELPDVEKKILGFTHVDVGALSARKWGLPSEIVDVLYNHHNYNLSSQENMSLDLKQVIYIVQLADIISVYICKNEDWNEWDKGVLHEKFENECLSTTSIEMNVSIVDFLKNIEKIEVLCEFDMKKLLLQ